MKFSFKIGQHLGPGPHLHCASQIPKAWSVCFWPVVWIGVITCKFAEASPGTGRHWWGRCVPTHANLFIQHAPPGCHPGLTHLLLVIKLYCPNTPFLREDSLGDFVIYLGVERVLAFFPVIRSSLLGIEPGFLHPNDFS